MTFLVTLIASAFLCLTHQRLVDKTFLSVLDCVLRLGNSKVLVTAGYVHILGPQIFRCTQLPLWTLIVDAEAVILITTHIIQLLHLRVMQLHPFLDLLVTSSLVLHDPSTLEYAFGIWIWRWWWCLSDLKQPPKRPSAEAKAISIHSSAADYKHPKKCVGGGTCWTGPLAQWIL